MNRLRRMGMSGGGGASGFDIDMSAQASSYPGIVIANTGTVYVDINGVPTLVTGATTPWWEDDGSKAGPGIIVMPSTTNSAPSATDFSVAGWGKVRGSTVTASPTVLAPDGLTQAQKVNDTNAGDSAEVRLVLTSREQYSYCWMMDATPLGTLSPQLLRADYTGTNVPWQTSGTRVAMPTWTYVENYDSANATWCGFAIDAGGASHSSTITGVGSIYVWGFSSTLGPMRPPLITSGTAQSAMTLDAAHIAQLVDAAGNFDVEITWTPRIGDMTSRVLSAAQNLNIGDMARVPMSYILSVDTPDGAIAIRHRAATGGAAAYYTLTMRGVDVLSSVASGWNNMTGQGLAAKVRPFYNRTSGISGIRVSVNGCFVPDSVGVASGATLAAATAAYVGTNLGSGTAALTGRVSRIRRPTSPIQAVEPVEIIISGDSIIGTFGTSNAAVGAYIYERDEIGVRPGIGSIAASGHPVSAQSAAFSSSPWSTASGIAAVVVQIGINDLIGVVSAATLIARIQTYVGVIRAAQPTTKIVICQMLPCKVYINTFNAGNHVVWQAVNDAIAGTGGSPITGVDGRVLTGDVGSPLNNGLHELPTAYALGDGIHTNNPGRAANAAMIRTVLVAQGVLPA